MFVAIVARRRDSKLPFGSYSIPLHVYVPWYVHVYVLPRTYHGTYVHVYVHVRNVQ